MSRYSTQTTEERRAYWRDAQRKHRKGEPVRHFTTQEFEGAQIILGKRYPDAVEDQQERWRGQFWKRVGDEWLMTTGAVGDVLGRLEQADGLWKNKSAMRIGMKLVWEAVEAARRGG